VTKRLIKGLFADPPGWPENSPVWGSTMIQGPMALPSPADSEVQAACR
jgi:hypothetical protein